MSFLLRELEQFQADEAVKLRAEIERLRAILAASCTEDRKEVGGGCILAAEMQAEIERLRAMLADASIDLRAWSRHSEPSANLLGDLADEIDAVLKPSAHEQDAGEAAK